MEMTVYKDLLRKNRLDAGNDDATTSHFSALVSGAASVQGSNINAYGYVFIKLTEIFQSASQHF
jgi:hypothetical protein